MCGPMPLAAMKTGDISEKYDGAFIFAEVNADMVIWEVDGDKETPLQVITN